MGHYVSPVRSCVVVGATGIFAPLGRLLADTGLVRVGVSRGRQPDEGEWDRLVRLDGPSAPEVQALVARDRPAVVVGYAPALSPASWHALTRSTEHAVLVVTSRFAAPGSDPFADEGWLTNTPTTVVQLGWTDEPRPRWHTAEEVSRAVAPVVLSGPERVELGRVRPWRPPA